MQCERCLKEHDGSFGCGRFCCVGCANKRALSQDVYDQIGQKLSKINPLTEISDENFRTCVQEAKNWTQLLSLLNVEKTSTNIRHAKIRALDLGIDYSHFRGQRSIEKLLSLRPNEPKGHLREALIKLGRVYKCEKCGLGDHWQNEKLTLTVDHINGNRYDHHKENLRFLCPNCHSQTSTFAWKNAKHS